MKQHQKAQVHALDRVMYLLEERSIQNLAMTNEDFASFIEQLYSQVEHERTTLAAHRS